MLSVRQNHDIHKDQTKVQGARIIKDQIPIILVLKPVRMGVSTRIKTHKDQMAMILLEAA